MGDPVTIKGSVRCAHGGSARLGSDTKLTVHGRPVLTFESAASLGPYTGCTPPPPGQPCVTTLVGPPPNPGQSSTLTVNGGDPVLLAGLQATSQPLATPVTVTAGQTADDPMADDQIILTAS